MSLFLSLAFLFFIGSVLGWVLELFFRRFFSAANPERKWINPGFLVGPYVPLYGFGLCLLYLISNVSWWGSDPVFNRVLTVLLMGLAMTAIEYLAGLLCLKWMKVRLWDYRGQWGNIQGLICPKFSLAWLLLGAAYYFFVHPYVCDAVAWLSGNLAFSFVIGLFFGVLLIDFVHSTQLVMRMKQFAKENNIIVRYEHVKAYIRKVNDEQRRKVRFLQPFGSDRPLPEQLHNYLEQLRQRGQELEKILRRKK